jgi:hypothetical protein
MHANWKPHEEAGHPVGVFAAEEHKGGWSKGERKVPYDDEVAVREPALQGCALAVCEPVTRRRRRSETPTRRKQVGEVGTTTRKTTECKNRFDVEFDTSPSTRALCSVRIAAGVYQRTSLV